MKRLLSIVLVLGFVGFAFAEDWAEYEMRSWREGKDASYDDYSNREIESLDQLIIMATIVAADNNFTEYPEWEAAASCYWNDCIENNQIPTFQGFRLYLDYTGTCDLEKMDQYAREQGFANFYEYDEWKFQQDINS